MKQRLESINWGRVGIAAVPWFWLGLFFVLPFLFVLKISLAEPQLSAATLYGSGPRIRRWHHDPRGQFW